MHKWKLLYTDTFWTNKLTFKMENGIINWSATTISHKGVPSTWTNQTLSKTPLHRPNPSELTHTWSNGKNLHSVSKNITTLRKCIGAIQMANLSAIDKTRPSIKLTVAPYPHTMSTHPPRPTLRLHCLFQLMMMFGPRPYWQIPSGLLFYLFK